MADRTIVALPRRARSRAACAIGLPSVLASTTTGEIRQPWPAGYGIESSMLAGGTAVAIGVPTGQRPAGGVSGRVCPPPVLLSYDLASRQVRTYRLPAGDARHAERAAAVSADGRRVVLDNL